MEIDSGSAPLTTTNSDGSSQGKRSKWDRFTSFRLALAAYAALALVRCMYDFWPDYLAWLAK